MHDQSSYKFAFFPNIRRARRAKQVVESTIDGDAKLVRHASELRQDRLPLRETMAPVGAAIGAAVVTSLAIVGLFGLAGAGLQPLGLSFAMIAGLTLLAALFGALSGALAFSTEARGKLAQLRAKLRQANAKPDAHPAVLLFDAEREGDMEGVLRRHGATRVGSLV